MKRHESMLAIASLCVFVLVETATAQTTQDALMLPGDDLPPPVEQMVTPRPLAPPGTPAPARPTQPPPPPGPSFDVAMAAARAALDFCNVKGTRVGVAVSDSKGNLIVGLSVDGAPAGRIYTAARKNLAAIAFGRPSLATQAAIAAREPAALALVKPNMMFWGGAVPLVSGEKTIGAIGTSGGSPTRDEECAAAGAAAIQSRL